MEELKYKIYKLHYTDNEAAHNDLLAKGIYEVTEDGTRYINGTQAVVYLGKIVEVPATETEPPIYYDGVFYDVMTTEEVDFRGNEIFPKEYVHTFLGYPSHPETEEENKI